MVCELGEFSTEDQLWDAVAQLSECIPDLGPEHMDRMMVRRQGKFHCFRIIIKAPCECTICTQQFRPASYQGRWTFAYTKALSDIEALRESMALVEGTRKNLQYLKQQCDVNGSIIVKRWKKKSSEKRKDLLLEVDPDMYPHQWSDIHFTKEFQPIKKAIASVGIEAWPDPDATQGRARRPYRNVCLLPYINLESLKDDPARLLNILHNRVEYSPQQWAPYDNSLLEKQWRIGALALTYNRMCVIMNGPKYGKLANWTERAAHAELIVGFPRAFLVLEAQWKLSCFLKAIVEKLVEGGGEPKESSTLSHALETGLRKRTEKSSCVEFASVYLNQPLSRPPIFDIQSLLDISEAKMNLHGDHLWLLQTDPLSLRRYTQVVLDGGFGENLTIEAQHILAALKLMEDATTYWTWEWIHEALLDLKGQGKIHPDKPLPSGYEQSLGCLEALIFDLTRRRSIWALVTLPLRPGLRDNYDVKFVQRLQSMYYIPQRKDNYELTDGFYEDRLDFCLTALAIMLTPDSEMANPDHNWEFHEPSDLFAILEDHLSTSTSPEKKEDIARMDEILYNSYSDLSALFQLHSMVRLHVPRAPVHTFDQAKEVGRGKAWRYSRAGFLDQDPRVGNHKNTEDTAEKIKAQEILGKLMGEFLATPKPTGYRATKKWLDEDEAQREACARLWAQMRSRHSQTMKRIKIGPEDIKSDLRILSADLAPEYLASVQAERAEILARIAAKKATNTARNTSKVEIQTQWGSAGDKSIHVQQPKVKVKTRTETSLEGLALSDLALTNPVIEPTPVKVKVGVNKGTLETLQSLYPKSNFEERTKSIAWASFVHAMAEVGFKAIQKHGSEYSFEPTSLCQWYGCGKIIFHRPHPESKYEAQQLLNIGKRMGKWFDWNTDTFCLLTKSPA